MRDCQFDFEKLISPVTVESFIRTHWGQKPLVIDRGQPDYYSSIFSIEDVESIVGFRQLKYSQLKVAKTEKDRLASTVFYVDGEDTSDLNRLYSSYHQGDTLAFNFAQCYWEPAAKICSELENFFHFPVGVNIYFTPRNAQGFPPHFDTHEVFVVQVEGSKLWRLYDSFEQLPSGLEDNQPISPEILGTARQEFRLTAGDLLYVPRGCVHEACTTDKSSIHFTIGVRPYKWTDLLSELLTLEAQENPALCEALPIGFLDSQEVGALIGDRVPELIAMLSNSKNIENSIGRLRERLIERMRPLPDGHFRSLDKVDQIDLDTVLAKRRSLMCHVVRNDDAVELAFPGNRIRGPTHIEAAFRFIADSRTDFPVRALPSPLTDNAKLVLAQRAVREGLLTIAELGKP